MSCYCARGRKLLASKVHPHSMESARKEHGATAEELPPKTSQSMPATAPSNAWADAGKQSRSSAPTDRPNSIYLPPLSPLSPLSTAPRAVQPVAATLQQETDATGAAAPAKLGQTTASRTQLRAAAATAPFPNSVSVFSDSIAHLRQDGSMRNDGLPATPSTGSRDGFGISLQSSTGFGRALQSSPGFGRSLQSSTGFGNSFQSSTGFGRSLQEEEKQLMRDIVEVRKARRQLCMTGGPESSAAAMELKQMEVEAEDKLTEVRNARALASAAQEVEKQLMRDVVDARKAQRRLGMTGESEPSAAATELKHIEEEAQEKLTEIRNMRALKKAERGKFSIAPPMLPPLEPAYGQPSAPPALPALPVPPPSRPPHLLPPLTPPPPRNSPPPSRNRFPRDLG